jgi:hypothetical protein
VLAVDREGAEPRSKIDTTGDRAAKLRAVAERFGGRYLPSIDDLRGNVHTTAACAVHVPAADGPLTVVFSDRDGFEAMAAD